MPWCNPCDHFFSTWTGLKEHWVQSSLHPYCQQCNEHFHDFNDLEEHYEDYHWRCEPCNKFFTSEHGLHEHYRQSSIRHYYCLPCKRLFKSESNLNSHLNSSTHRPKDVACPFRGCDKKFVSRSALVLHLESGRCKSNIDRATINRFVHQCDTKNVITDGSRLLTSGTTNDNVKYYASARSWNGSGYECYLCHRVYPLLKSLNQHLESPAHEDKIYICPASACRTRFLTLSALCQHIESESCGVFKFKAVQDTMDNIFTRMRHLTL